MRAFVAALFLALSAPTASFRARSAASSRVQIVLVNRLRRERKPTPRRRARLRWER